MRGVTSQIKRWLGALYSTFGSGRFFFLTTFLQEGWGWGWVGVGFFLQHFYNLEMHYLQNGTDVVLFSSWKINEVLVSVFETVAILFLFNKYYPIIE